MHICLVEIQFSYHIFIVFFFFWSWQFHTFVPVAPNLNIDDRYSLTIQILSVYECEGWNISKRWKIGLAGSWIGRFIFHRVDIFQPSHEFKTVDTCFLSLLHKFYNVICNLWKLQNGFYYKQKISFFGAVVWNAYEPASPNPRKHALCTKCTIKQRRW